MRKKQKRIIKKDNNAQLLLIAGISICVLIIVSSAATVSMVDSFVPTDKTSSIKTEYDNVRNKFGLALQDHLEGKLETADVNYWFDITNNLFSYALARHNYYFNAVLVDTISSNGDNDDSIIVILNFSNKNDCITEQIEYYIG